MPLIGNDTFGRALSSVSEAAGVPGARREVAGLLPPARALFLTLLCQRIKGSLLIITRDRGSAEELHGNMQFFFAGDKGGGLYYFPHLRSGFMSKEARIGRLEALEGMCRGDGGPVAVVAPLSAVLQGVPRKETFSASVFDIAREEIFDRDRLARLLSQNGYNRTDMVEEVGEYSIRGGILDVFPPQAENPARIEFFGDQVESIREFNAADQLSFGTLEKLRIVPVADPGAEGPPLDGENLQGSTWTIFDYLSPGSMVVLDEADSTNDELKAALKEGPESEEPLEDGELPPSSPLPHRVDPGLVVEKLGESALLELFTLPLDEEPDNNTDAIDTRTVASFRGRFNAFVEQLKEWDAKGYSTLLISHNHYQARRMKALLQDYDLGVKVFNRLSEIGGGEKPDAAISLPPIAICVGSLKSGFEIPAAGIVLVTEAEVFGATRKVREKGKRVTGKFVSDFRDLRMGDFVVHVDYGIGRYLGISNLNVNDSNAEFLKIQYGGGQHLYVPLESLNLVQKYMGSGEGGTKLDALGTSAWKKRKAKVKESIRRLAKELLELYATREVVEGHPFSPDDQWHQEFDSAFEYEETPDQLKAIEEVKADMERPRPMDRLICGDVGYGKTEVAMRAGFKTVMDSKQVAVLVPTTLLAQQHVTTFQQRFQHYPVKIEVLSRFKTPSQQKAIIDELYRGGIDIIIGTHRLLQKDVRFKDLGLLVIDEEQRFGVRDKEKIKRLSKSVDVLTLTATPIPRTLHLSLMGVRDLSIIDTPPQDRLSIETHLVRFKDEVIKKAILSELERGGQIYFVHNRVQSIEAMRKYLRKLVPQVRIGVVHGQLRERPLEDKMIRFLNREYDLLLTTTIIESGLDIHSVNTIIINRADRFGLAQLYQLRGRVGRDKYKAYAYLLIPGGEAITSVARQRLKALQELTELGSGFHLAARDMEIRGAGNILGAEQSGQIAALGFDLYCRLIEETIQELRGEEHQEEIETEIDLGYRGFIPREYVSDTNLRLMIYKKLSSLRQTDELNSYAEELEDRYGKIPADLTKLLEYFQIKILALKLKLEKLKIKDGNCLLTFHKSTPIHPSTIIEMVREEGEKVRFISEDTIQIKLYDNNGENIFIAVRKILQDFINNDNLNTKLK